MAEVTTELVADVVPVRLPAGGRALVAGDLHLTATATAVSTLATEELARAVDGWVGPGVIILNGNLVELLSSVAVKPGETSAPPLDPVRALEAHPRLLGALAGFAGADGREVVVLVGSHDSRLAWDVKAARRLGAATGGARLGLAVELEIETGRGCRRVRVEPGWRFDPLQARADPRNPSDTPLAHHIVTQLLPGFRSSRGDASWLDGIDDLADPGSFPAFVASRLTYRRLAHHAWWLVVPFVLALVLRVPLAYGLFEPRGVGNPWPHRLIGLGAGAVIDLLLVAAGVLVVSRSTWEGLGDMVMGVRIEDRNEAARDEARRLVTSGYAGLITGHTHEPELVMMGGGFHANTGCLHEVLLETETYLSLPPVFLPHRQISWVELEAGAELHVRVLHARTLVPGATRLERLAARNPPVTDDHHPTVVASFPAGPSWPPQADPGNRLRRIRRWSATFIGVAGLLDIVSALTPPLAGRIHVVTRLVPLAVPETAAALVALGGVALLALARGVRRGQRHAWAVACVLIAGTVALHVLKGGDLDESAVAVAILAFLLVNRAAFEADFDVPSLLRGLVSVVVGGVIAVVVSVLALEVVHGSGQPRPPLGRVIPGVAERLVGVHNIVLRGRAAAFLTPVLLGVGLGLVVIAGALLVRPVVARALPSPTGLARARDVITRHGGDTLAYFALRADKSHFFHGDSVVAYAVISGVCLVSPDPIGPAAERDEVWDAFRAFADDHGWTVAVLGAGEEWLPVYRETGMHDIYMGDEGVVDLRRFTLEGGRNKGLRQAVNRIAKYGYTIEFFDPAHLDADLEAKLRTIMTQSRRGGVERGFSMTLGRIFDKSDEGLLLAVAYGPSGEPVAFCQFVPATAIDGYSLDLMRRDQGEHPNGITDFIVVRTIERLRDEGRKGLGLNFATMRAVLAGETGEGAVTKVERWLLKRMNDSMQIESLWRYNAKFDPDWKARYAVYDSAEHVLPAALAVARAESFWELPLIGRFLVPTDNDRDMAVEPDADVLEPSGTPRPQGDPG